MILTTEFDRERVKKKGKEEGNERFEMVITSKVRERE